MLFYDKGQVFDLLGGFYIGHGPALRAEGHEYRKNQHRNAEQHKGQEKKSAYDIGCQRYPIPAVVTNVFRINISAGGCPNFFSMRHITSKAYHLHTGLMMKNGRLLATSASVYESS